MSRRLNEMNANSDDDNFFLDEKAFRNYYEEHRGRLFRYTNQLIRNKEAAKDIVNEVFCNTWRLQKTFENPRNVDAYLYVSCRNKAYTFLKYGSQFTNNKEIALEDIESVPVDDQLLRDLAYKEHLEAVRRALLVLPDKRREVLRLSFFEHFTTAEIAKVLSMTPENVRVTRSQGLSQLRDIIESSLLVLIAIFLFF